MNKGLVSDANILIRAVLGRRVFELLERYGKQMRFCAPDRCFAEARKHLPLIVSSRNKANPAKPISLERALFTLDQLAGVVEPVAVTAYSSHKLMARLRMQSRDIDDWPVAALALVTGFPIWTEDRDFFGCGIATWTTDRVELYLQQE